MNLNPTTKITPTTQRIDLPNGHIMATCWTPPQHNKLAPLVLFHDSLGCVALWRDFPARLAMHSARQVVAYDRVGFGQSSARTGAIGLDFIGRESRDFFPYVHQAMGLDAFVAIGHSVGGGMATYTAAAYAQQCLALVSIAAQFDVDETIRQGIRDAMVTFAKPEVLARLTHHHGDKAAWVLSAWADTWLSEAFADWTLQHALQQVRCPTLAIHGQNDEYGTLAHPERIAQYAGQGGRMWLLDNIGHIPHRECPETLVHGIVAFLQDQKIA